MIARLKVLWVTARDSLWFLPGTLTLFSVVLAFLMIKLDRDEVFTLSEEEYWLLGGGAEGARGVLSAIAGGLFTVTGVVFSVTIVALQLASSQFTPRILRTFTADRGNQLVLGVFIGSFTYSLLVLRVVSSGSDGDGPGAFVPRISVTVAILLVLVSIGFLIYFVDHASRSIQVSVILHRVAKQTLVRIERVFPTEPGTNRVTNEEPPEPPRGDPIVVASSATGYLQAVDSEALCELARARKLVIRTERLIGEFLLPGRPLATIWPASAVDEEAIEKGRAAFVLGLQRTIEQDVEFGIIEISDIAVKALSPSINDPTTALHCLDRLSEILCALGGRPTGPDVREVNGQVHFIGKRLGFDHAVSKSFAQIRHFGASNPTIAKKLLDVFDQLLEVVPPVYHPPLLEQREAILADSREAIESHVDRADLERVAAKLRPDPKSSA